MKWTKSMIRRKIEYLDTITGLEGGELPISFDNSYDSIGHFGGTEGKERGLTFSRLYFQSPYFSKRMACEAIMHEYAHFMSHMRGEKPGHGREWRECCRKIGLVDHFWVYRPDINREYLEEELGCSARQKLNLKNYMKALERYEAGMRIMHPAFGSGMVESREGEGESMRLTVRFGKEMKLLNARWVDDHCKVESEAVA